MMGEPVEKRRRHLGVAENARPFTESEIGRDEDRSAFIESADQVEEELAADLGKGQIAEFVEDDEVKAREIFGKTSLPSGPAFSSTSSPV